MVEHWKSLKKEDNLGLFAKITDKMLEKYVVEHHDGFYFLNHSQISFKVDSTSA